jgi:hypothetical protein
VGRVQLYAMTGVVGPVYASKRLFTRLDFQSDKGLESARMGNCNESVSIFHSKPLASPLGESTRREGR